MADFGWAFVKGNLVTGSAPPSGAIQYNDGNNKFAASSDFTFISGSTSQLNLTGTLNVSGAINANRLNITVTNQNVINLTSTGSTRFGDTSDDLHQFSGSVNVSGNITATSFFGDGSNLTGIPAGANTQIQFNNGGAFGASSNLRFAGSTLIVTGSMDVAGNVSASLFFGNGSNLTNLAAGSNNQVQFNNSNNLGGSSNLTFNGSLLGIAGRVSSSLSMTASAFKGDGAGLTGIVGGLNNQVQFNSSDDFAGSANLTFNGTKLGVLGNISASVNISASAFFGDGSSLTGIATNLDQVTSNGNTTSNAMTASTMRLTGVPAGQTTNTKFLALDSSNNIITTSSAGSGTSMIGAAEDGSYADGLFTDFASNTLVGVAVDRFNEVLKILAPSPSPALSRINSTGTTGTTVKLSFGASNAVSGYTRSNTQAGFIALDVTGTYQNTTSGNNFRLGAYKNDKDITGILNFDVTLNSQNDYVAYSADSFGNAETGSLKLEVNGAVIHTVNLSSFAGSGNPPNGTANSLTTNSGFTNISVSASSFDGNNSEWHIFKHRTANYRIDTDAMIPGWNYARVIHTIGGTNYNTNYIEWVNDPSGAVNDLSAADGRIENIVLVGSKYLSGVQYNTDANAKYKVNLNNMYRNVYAASGTPVSFTVSNSTTPSAQAVPDINTGGGDTHTKIIRVTASLDCNQTSLVSGAMTANVTATHPFKTTLSNAGATTTGNGFLIDNRTLSSTNILERFHDETFRITAGNYTTQNSITASAAQWNSQHHMTGGGAAGHTDGLIFFNQRLYSPIDSDLPNAGNFSNLLNVESGQPNYAGVTGTRNFYRILSNSLGSQLFNLKLDSTKNSTTYNATTLTTNNVHFAIKIPGKTGWMDISQNFVYGQVADGNGALIGGAGNDVDSGDNTHHITFGTASVANGENMVLRIQADESWAGYLSQLSFTLPSNQNQATPAILSDINATNQGKTAKLSFGASNEIATYSRVNGASIGSTTFNSNDHYAYGGSTSNTRGVFPQAHIISGSLNDAIAAGSGYAADAFFNGFSGSIVLEVNGAEVHSLSLSNSLGAISNNFNGNGSGFDLSDIQYSNLSNIPRYDLPYRTGTYRVATADQRNGWNYARVIHRTSGDQTTNYVEWVVDPSGSVEDTAVANQAMGNFNHPTTYYQSGIGYFAARPTGSFSYLASNFYRNVYSTGSSAINFPTTTNCSITNVRMAGAGVTTTNSASATSGLAVLDNSANCQNTTLQVTGTVLFDNSLVSISGGLGQFTSRTVQVNSTIRHPFKNDKTTSTVSKTGFMVFSGAVGSTNENTLEYFGMESFRIVSGNYGTQTLATGSVSKWNSTTAMNNGGTHDDGMVTANGHLISPFQIGFKGDTRRVEESGVLQAPAGNPNYSSLTTATRTYYRYFRNNTANDRSSITITLHGSGSMVEKSTALSNNGNFHLEVKIPESTAWLDAGKSYISNNKDTDGSGALVGGSSPTPISTSGTSFSVTFNGGSQLGNSGGNKAVVLKLSTHKDWIGYLERITISYS